MSREVDSPLTALVMASEQQKPSVLRFVRIEHGYPREGALYTKVASRLTGSSWFIQSQDFSLDWVRNLPICLRCGLDLIDGEQRLCSPCEASEVMPLIRAFQQDLRGI